MKGGSNGALVSQGNQHPGRKEFLRKAYSRQWLVSVTCLITYLAECQTTFTHLDPESHRLYINPCAHFTDEEIEAWKGDVVLLATLLTIFLNSSSSEVLKLRAAFSSTVVHQVTI